MSSEQEEPALTKGDQRLPLAASRYLDQRIYTPFGFGVTKRLSKRVLRTDYDRLWKQAQSLPEEWRTHTALARLSESLNTLSCSSIIENALGTLLAQQSQAEVSKEHDHPMERKPVLSVLRPGVQGAAAGRCVVA